MSKKKPIVIAVSGKAHAGKDTVLEMLKKKLPGKVAMCSHAHPLKQLLINTLHFKHEQLYDQKHKHDINEMWNMTGREAMCKIGTDGFRNHFHPNIWIKLLNYTIDKSDADFILIQDCRFENEAVNIKNVQKGYVINVVRDLYYKTKRYAFFSKIFKKHQWLFWALYKVGLISFRWHESEVHNLTKFYDAEIYNTGSMYTLNELVDHLVDDIKFEHIGYIKCKLKNRSIYE